MGKLKQQRRNLVTSCGFWLSLVLVIGAEVTLFKLAGWQYARAGEKEVARAAVLAAREIDVSWPPTSADIGHRVTFSQGAFIPGSTYLLEHQQKQDGAGVRTGWRVFSLFQIPNAPAVWIDRGWTPYPRGQARLTPDLTQYEPPRNAPKITGLVQPFPTRKDGSWGGATTTTHSNVLAFLSEGYLRNNHPYAHPTFYLQSLTPTGENVTAVAAPLPAPGRHREYMFTWLGLALILPLLYGGAVLQVWRRRTS